MSLPANLPLLRAKRIVETGKNFASDNFSVIGFDGSNFEPVEQTSEIVSDLLAGLDLDSEDSESDRDASEVKQQLIFCAARLVF
jgi:hypothetical protein